tara:strand:- start:265 stop:468 length:204 start_codon:yes stop_codon:yes gene_type:complete
MVKTVITAGTATSFGCAIRIITFAFVAGTIRIGTAALVIGEQAIPTGTVVTITGVIAGAIKRGFISI